MRYRPLGRTGQFVSEICLGAMTFHGGSAGGMWRNIGTLDQAAATKLVARALDAGVNFIDTADVYSEGDSEKLQSVGALKARLAARAITNRRRDEGARAPSAGH